MKRKIRIVFVGTNCKRNGPIKQTLYIIKNLDRIIFEPFLVTIWPEEENTMLEEYRKLGVTTICCGLGKKKSIIFGKSFVTKILNEINPDIIHGIGMPPYRMTLGYKKAVHFTTLRNYCYEDYPDQYAKVIGTIMAYMDIKLIRKQMRKGEPFVACSESLTNIYKEKEELIIPYIRNGIDISQYKKRELHEIETLRNTLGLPLHKIIFVFSGKIIERKNQKEAIEGFIKMQNRNQAILLLLGEGKNKEELEKKYGGHKDIIFMGKVNNVRDYLAASDIYISTSKSEGLPNGVLEAMAVGLPILLSDIPQHLEIISAEDYCGTYYHLSDIDCLSKRMDEFIFMDRIKMGHNCFKSILSNFAAIGMSEAYQSIYKKMLQF